MSSENQLVLLIIPFLCLFGCKLVIIHINWTDIISIDCAHLRYNAFNFSIKRNFAIEYKLALLVAPFCK